jgi:hypothetical protein
MFLRFAVLSGLVWAGFWSFGLADLERQPPDTLAPLVIPATTTTTSTTIVYLDAHSVLEADIEKFDALDAFADNPYAPILALAMDAGWPADVELLDTLADVIHKESRGRMIVGPSSRGPGHEQWNGHDWGYVQINEIHTAYVEQIYGVPFAEAMSDPWKNLNFAWILYSGRQESGKCGWQPWSVECD